MNKEGVQGVLTLEEDFGGKFSESKRNLHFMVFSELEESISFFLPPQQTMDLKRTHGTVKPGNFIVYSGRYVLIDFETSAMIGEYGCDKYNREFELERLAFQVSQDWTSLLFTVDFFMTQNYCSNDEEKVARIEKLPQSLKERGLEIPSWLKGVIQIVLNETESPTFIE